MGDVIKIADAKPLSRPEKFAVELDRKLPTFTTDWSRKTFLTALLHNWELRYSNFLQRSRTRGFDPGDVTAFDYANTIAEISVRLAKYEGARHA